MEWTSGSFKDLLKIMGWWIGNLLDPNLHGVITVKVGRECRRGLTWFLLKQIRSSAPEIIGPSLIENCFRSSTGVDYY